MTPDRDLGQDSTPIGGGPVLPAAEGGAPPPEKQAPMWASLPDPEGLQAFMESTPEKSLPVIDQELLRDAQNILDADLANNRDGMHPGLDYINDGGLVMGPQGRIEVVEPMQHGNTLHEGYGPFGPYERIDKLVRDLADLHEMDAPAIEACLKGYIEGAAHSQAYRESLANPTPAPELLANFHKPRALGTTPEPDNGPVEPWKVQPWVQEVLEAHPMSLDVETTGLNGTVVEIGVVNPSGDVLFHAFVQPLEPIDPAASAKTGLTTERLQDLGAKPWPEVARELNEAVNGGVLLQYANSFFDKAAIERTDRAAGIEGTLSLSPWVDVMDAYQHANALPKSMKLVEAAADMGVHLPESEAHGAIADARAAMGVFKALADRNLADRMTVNEVLVRRGEHGLEAYSPEGRRLKAHELHGDRLQRAFDEASAQWPPRAKQFIDKGDFMRVAIGENWRIDRASNSEHFPAILAGAVQRMNEYDMEGGPMAGWRSARSFAIEVAVEMGVHLSDDEAWYLGREVAGNPFH